MLLALKKQRLGQSLAPSDCAQRQSICALPQHVPLHAIQQEFPAQVRLKIIPRGRILFLRSPGASARVRANVLECNPEFVDGRISLYDEEGKPCVLIDGFRAISVAGIRRDSLGGTRDVLYHIDWERTPPVSKPAPLTPVP